MKGWVQWDRGLGDELRGLSCHPVDIDRNDHPLAWKMLCAQFWVGCLIEPNIFLKKKKFFFDVDHFLKSLLNLLQYSFCFILFYFGHVRS